MRDKFSEMIRFGIVGVVATLIQYAVYYLLLPYMDERLALHGRTPGTDGGLRGQFLLQLYHDDTLHLPRQSQHKECRRFCT